MLAPYKMPLCVSQRTNVCVWPRYLYTGVFYRFEISHNLRFFLLTFSICSTVVVTYSTRFSHWTLRIYDNIHTCTITVRHVISVIGTLSLAITCMTDSNRLTVVSMASDAIKCTWTIAVDLQWYVYNHFPLSQFCCFLLLFPTDSCVFLGI